MLQVRQPEVYRSAVRQQLRKVLAHPLFKRSERMRRFLRLAVEHTLDGKAAELKEYLVGVEVFDRRQSYDPRVDPIVRVEARRLRSKLRAYYDSDGRSDAIVIEFVTGSYAPQIHVRAAPAPPPAPQPEPGVNTIAVLPLVNLSPNPEHEYFSDGLTEELIHALTKVPGMRVVAWNSAARLRERQEDLLAVRQQLRAATALTGSVRISGSSLRVRAQLVDTETGVYLWSETFDRPMQDVFAIQEEIARAIVRTLSVHLAAGWDDAAVGRNRTTLSSYDLYLRGRYFWHQRTPESLHNAIRHFEAAVAADERSALAYAGLADGYSLLVDYGLMLPDEGVPRAKAAASRAVELDPSLAEPYPSLALICSHYDRDWKKAGYLYQRALELNPNYPTTHHWMATDYYLLLGRFDQALDSIHMALQLDPISSILHEGHGFIHMVMGRYEEALRIDRGILESDPSFYKAMTSMGRAYLQMGNYAEAISTLERGRSMAGDLPSILGALGQAYGLAGDGQRARDLLAHLQEIARARFIPATPMVMIHMGLGEKQQALDCLETAFDRHEVPLTALGVHPAYDSLRGDPRFESLLTRLGLR